MILARVFTKNYKDSGIILIDSKGQKYICGNPRKEKPITVKLLKESLNWRLLVNPELEFPEAYMRNEILIENASLKDFLMDLIKNLGRNEFSSASAITKKIYQTMYKLTFINEEYAEAELIENVGVSLMKDTITFDFKKKTITKLSEIKKPNDYSYKFWKSYKMQCEFNSSTGSSDDVASSGSGFFINNKGYFITNNHVVKGCKQSKINFKEEEVDAELIATDETLDLALLRAKVKPKDYLNISDDPPEKMQRIFVAGYPFGKGLSDALKFTQGIISAVKGYADNSNQIQLDAAINPGNSGGPIVNEDGDLVDPEDLEITYEIINNDRIELEGLFWESLPIWFQWDITSKTDSRIEIIYDDFFPGDNPNNNDTVFFNCDQGMFIMER